MKNSIFLVALAILFIFGCNETPNNSSSNRVNDPNFPTTNDGPNSITDIPTPSYSSHTTATGTTSGYKVCLSWNHNTPSTPTSAYAQDPTSPTDINFGHNWEYWGTTQLLIVGPGSNGHENQPYSGHYEIYRDGVKIADVTGSSYCDDNLAAGTYTYTIKSKSLEGVQPNAMTHHSLESDGYEVTVGCEYSVSGNGPGGSVIWGGSDLFIENAGRNQTGWPLKFHIYLCDEEIAGDGDDQINGDDVTLTITNTTNPVQTQTVVCDYHPDDLEWMVHAPNLNKPTATTYSVVFKIGTTVIGTFTLTSN